MQKSEKQQAKSVVLRYQNSNPSANLAPFHSILLQIKDFSECVMLQIQAQQNYQSHLVKFVQKLNSIYYSIEKKQKTQTQPSVRNEQKGINFVGLIRFLIQIHTQKIDQINAYKLDLISDYQQLKKVAQKGEQAFAKRLKEIKDVEKDTKSYYQKLKNQKQKIQKTLRELDQKLITNQIAILNRKNLTSQKSNYSKEVSVNIVKQQKMLLDSYLVMSEVFQNQMQQSQKTMKNKWKSCNKAFEEVEQKFKDFVKKQTIQRVSLFRNMQYDVDIFIKKCGLFDDQLNEGAKQSVELARKQDQTSQQSKKKEKKRIGKLVWEKITPQTLQNNPHRRLMKFKQRLIQKQSMQGEKMETNQQKQNIRQHKVKELLKKIQFQGSFSLEVIQQYYKIQKSILIEAIQSYRMTNQFKFENYTHFENIKALIKFTIKLAYQQQDFLTIKNVILYASSYFYIKDQGSSKSQKIVVFDSIKRDLGFLKDLLFWKFFLVSAIQETVANCKMSEGQQSQKSSNSNQSQGSPKRNSPSEQNTVNAVYSTLLSNSLQLIGCEIQKNDSKNLISKCAKSFGIGQAQVGQLLKFVENGYENYQRNKIKALLQSKK